MAKRTTWLGQAVLLVAAAWMCVGGTRAAAQAAAEAGALGAASSSVGSAAGKATGNAVGGALGGLGASTNAATSGAAGGSTNGSAAPAGKAATPAPSSTTIHFIPRPDADVEAGGAMVEGPPPDIHFDVVSFQRCNGGVGSNKVDLPMDGDTVAYHCQPVFRIIYFAYQGLTAGTLTLGGYPQWVETDLYNFEAKVAPEDVAAWQKLSLDARRVALRSLLADALKLKVHADAAQRPVYLLSVDGNGPKLKEYADGEQEKLPNGLLLTGKDMSWVGRVAYFQGMSMGILADSLSAHLDRPVLDRTGLTGAYDFALPLPYGSGTSANADLAENIPSVAEELLGLGLRLEAAKAEGDGLVVQHVERPAE